MNFDYEAPDRLEGFDDRSAIGGLIVKKKQANGEDADSHVFKQPEGSRMGLDVLAAEVRLLNDFKLLTPGYRHREDE